MTVQGSIGNEPVILENAATESTLRKLLKAAQQSADAIKKLAEESGIKVEEFNDTLEEFAENLEDINEDLDDLHEDIEDINDANKESIKLTDILNTGYEMLSSSIHGLIQGTTSASAILTSLSRELPPGVFRELAEQVTQLTRYQEENFQSYQKLTNAGITFVGALNQIRVAAAQSYMTLGEFTEMYAKNSEVFMKLGGTAEQGAENFAKLSSQLVKSDLGLQLQAMGYTTSQINQNMLDYLDITGGVNASELKNKKVVDGLVESSAEFMHQQDMLARLTGKSREALADEMKKKAQDASYQAALMRMSTEEQAKHIAAMQYATATGIEGAEDYYKSLVLGLPPMTEAGRMFAAMFSGAAGEFDKMAASAKNEKASIADLRQSFFATSEALINDVEQYSDTTLAALIQQGTAAGASAQSVMTFTNKLKQAGDDVEKREQAFNELQARTLRENKQAENMAKFNQSMQKLSAAINESFAPLIGLVADGLALLSYPINLMASGIEYVNKNLPGLASGIVLAGTAVAALTAAFVAAKTAVAAKGAIEGILGSGRGGKEEIADGAKARNLGIGLKVLAEVLEKAGRGAGQIIAGASSLSASIAIIGAGIGAGIVAIGAGIAAASWLIGKGLPSLAEGFRSFADIDGENLSKVGIGIASIATGLALMGVGTVAASAGSVIGGLIDGIGSLFGVKSPTEKLNEFAKLGPGLEEASSGLTGFISALEKLIVFDFDRVSAAADSIKKLSKTIKDVKIDQDIKKLSNSFDGITKITEPLKLLSDISNVGTSFDVSSAAINQYIENIEKLSQLDVSQLDSIGSSLSNLGKGLDQVGKGTGNSLFQTISQGLTQFTGTKTSIDQIYEYIELSDKLYNSVDKINGFIGSLTELTGFDLSSTADKINSFSSSLTDLSNFDLSSSVDNINGFIGSLTELSGFDLSSSVDKINSFSSSLTGLTNIDFSTINSLISNLSSVGIEFENLNSKASMPQTSMQNLINQIQNFKDLDISSEQIKRFSDSIESLYNNSQLPDNFNTFFADLNNTDYTPLEKTSGIIQGLIGMVSNFKNLNLNTQTDNMLSDVFSDITSVDNEKINLVSDNISKFIDNLNNQNFDTNANGLLNLTSSVKEFSKSIELLNNKDQSNIGILSSNLTGLTQNFKNLNDSGTDNTFSSVVSGLFSNLNLISKEIPSTDIFGAYTDIGLNLDVTTQKLESFISVMKKLVDLDFENFNNGINGFSNFRKSLPDLSIIENMRTLFETKPTQLTLPQLEKLGNQTPITQEVQSGLAATTNSIIENTNFVSNNQADTIVEELKHFTDLARQMVLQLNQSTEYQRRIANAAKSGGGLW